MPILNLTPYSDTDLDELYLAIEEEKRQRLLLRLQTVPNTAVVSLWSGFSGGPGRLMYCVTFVKKDESSEKLNAGIGTAARDFFGLSDVPNGEVRWLLEPALALESIRLAREDEFGYDAVIANS